VVEDEQLHFRGNIFSLDGKEYLTTEKKVELKNASTLGIVSANEVLLNGGKKIAEAIRNAAK
jgi:hydroxymethylbilane synthase